MRQLLSPHRLWQLARRRGDRRGAWWLAFQLRFDHGPNLIYSRLLDRTILLVVGIKLIVFIAFGFYNRWWRYVSIRDMWATVRGVVVACLLADLTVYLVPAGARLPAAAVDRRDRSPPHARPRPGLAPPRPHGDGAARA